MSPNAVITIFLDFVDNLWGKVVGLFFPKRCVSCGRSGAWLCHACFLELSYAPYQKCLVCGEPSIGGFTHPFCESRYNPDRFLSPFEYQGPLKEALRRAKYHGSFAFFSDLAVFLSQWIRGSGVCFLPGSVLVPVPLHLVRYWERGYNQSLILAKFLGENLDLPVSANLLRRIRYTRSQTRLSPKERKENVRGAFSCSPEVQGKNLVLVDDVSTSGATLLEAARTLKRGGARTVWCLALARAG